MIKLIGRKRAFFLALALAANAAAAGAYLFVVEPLQTGTASELQGTTARISKLSADIQNIKGELQEFPANYVRYQALEKAGFFSVQDRFGAGRALDELKGRSGVLGYTYRIDALQVLQDPALDAAGFSLVSSRISLEGINSVLDTGVFALLRTLQYAFAPHVELGSFEIERVREVDEARLKSLAQKGPEALVHGSVVFDWFTVAPKDALPGAGAEGFRGR